MLADDLRRLGAEVTVYPTARNCYADIKNGGPVKDFRNYGAVIEVHFNAFNGRAFGAEVLYKTSETFAAAVDKALAKAGDFTDRGPKYRTDLQDPNYAASLGVPYILIETCFIDNRDDMKKYEKKKAAIWEAVAEAVAKFYDFAPIQSKITLTGENWPGTLEKGERFVIKGKIRSAAPLRKVTVCIEEAETGKDIKEATKTKKTTAKTYDLAKIDPDIAFRKLVPGEYRYKVKAEDSNGTKKTLLAKTFKVTKAKK